MSFKHFIEWLPTRGVGHGEFACLSIFGTPITYLLNKYIFDDVEFITSLGVLIAIDTALSVAYHFKAKTLSSDGFAKFFSKIIIYGAVLIVIHTGTHIKTDEGIIVALQWLDSLGYTALYVREAISILEKAEKLSPGTLPLWIVKRLKDFDDNGNLKS